MSATHDHGSGADGRAHDAFGVQRRDPTGTTTLRRQYAAQYYKRYRRLKGLTWELVARRDVLGLGGTSANQPDPIDPDDEVDFPSPSDIPGIPDPLDPITPTPGLTPSPGAGWDIRDYVNWFGGAQNDLIRGPPMTDGGNARWTEDYVRYGYQKGVGDADMRAARIGAIGDGDDVGDVGLSFRMPIHQSTLDEAIERNAAGMAEFSQATTDAVEDVIVESVSEGHNARKAARRINDRVDAIGLTRAQTHARTTIVGTYNEASLRRYEQIMGSDGSVTMLAEFSTAGDSAVCPICSGMAGSRFSVREARGVIPVHPNCRCAWVPVPNEARPLGS